MNDETIVAVYDTAAHADAAVAALKAADVPESSISRHSATTPGAGASTAAAPPREEGFWASLFGGEPDHDSSVYNGSLESGSTVVTVMVPEEHVTRVTQILESHDPVDIDERASSYGLTQTTTREPLATPAPTAMSDRTTGTGDTIQLSEEQLKIGKRVVNRGGTRIRRYVVEKPVEQDVTLRDETVKVERRPVTDGRPVTGADFTDKTIEMTETDEEAVVGKEARVVEEVGLRKDVSDRVETVRDTVRKQEVEIEQIPGDATVKTERGTMPDPRTPKV